MNVLHLLWVFLTFVVFIIALKAYTTINRSDQNRYLNIHLQVFALAVFLFFVFGGILNLPLFLVYLFVAFSNIIPIIIGRFIQLSHIKFKQPLLRLAENSPTVLFWNMTITLLLIVFFLMSINKFVFTNDSLHDKNYYFDQAGIMLLAGLYLILQVMNLFQKVVFYPDGLFYNGVLWEWSDFQNYSWGKSLNHNKYQQLLLKTANDARFIKQIKLALPRDSKEMVNTLIEQKIERGSESS